MAAGRVDAPAAAATAEAEEAPADVAMLVGLLQDALRDAVSAVRPLAKRREENASTRWVDLYFAAAASVEAALPASVQNFGSRTRARARTQMSGGA